MEMFDCHLTLKDAIRRIFVFNGKVYAISQITSICISSFWEAHFHQFSMHMQLETMPSLKSGLFCHINLTKCHQDKMVSKGIGFDVINEFNGKRYS